MSLSTVTLLMLHQDINSAHKWRRPRGSVWANVWLILKAVKEQSRSQPTPKCHSPYIIPACIFRRGTPAIPLTPRSRVFQQDKKVKTLQSRECFWQTRPSIMQKVSMESWFGQYENELSWPRSLTWMLIYWLCHSWSRSDLWSSVSSQSLALLNWYGEWATWPQRVAQITVIQSDLFVKLVILCCFSHHSPRHRAKTHITLSDQHGSVTFSTQLQLPLSTSTNLDGCSS